MAVRVLLLLSADLQAEASGGIRTFVRDFVRHAPADFEISIAGSTSDPRTRPVGSWSTLSYGQRSARFLHLVHIPPDGRSRVPDLLRYVLALVLRRRRLPLADHNVQLHRPALGLAFVRHRGPLVQWLHLNPSQFAAHMRWRRVPGLLGLIERLTIPRMDYVVTPGSAVAELYRRRFPRIAERVLFSPNWFDDARFRVPSAEERAAARRAAEAMAGGLPAGSAVVLFVGRLEAQKDPLLLVDAFAELCRRRTHATLLMVGAGRMRGEVEARLGAAGIADRVRLLGSRSHEEVATLMRASDVLLLASHTEVSARVALEALGSGLPVVSPPAGEMERVVIHRQTGWIVGDRRPESLAEGLEWALDQPREALAAAAAASVSEYVPARALAPVYEMHRRLAAGQRAAR